MCTRGEWRSVNARRDCLRKLLSYLFCATLIYFCLYTTKRQKGALITPRTPSRTWLLCSITIVIASFYQTTTTSMSVADLKILNSKFNQTPSRVNRSSLHLPAERYKKRWYKTKTQLRNKHLFRKRGCCEVCNSNWRRLWGSKKPLKRTSFIRCEKWVYH